MKLTALTFIFLLLTTFGFAQKVTTNGKVGIGVTDPIEKLEVNGNTKTTGFIMPTGAVENGTLTSNAAGIASWKKKMIFKVAGLTDTIKVPGGFTTRVINRWSTVEINTANAFFSHPTGEVFIPQAGIYRITTRFHGSFDEDDGWYGVGVMVNGVTKGESWRKTNQIYNLIEGIYLLKLNAQDRIKIFIYNPTSSLAIGTFFIAGKGAIYNDFTVEMLD